MNRLRAAWHAFCHPNELSQTRDELDAAWIINQQVAQLERDLDIAKAGIRDLKAQLGRDYEAEAKAASDKIAMAALDAMGRQG